MRPLVILALMSCLAVAGCKNGEYYDGSIGDAYRANEVSNDNLQQNMMGTTQHKMW